MGYDLGTQQQLLMREAFYQVSQPGAPVAAAAASVARLRLLLLLPSEWTARGKPEKNTSCTLDARKISTRTLPAAIKATKEPGRVKGISDHVRHSLISSCERCRRLDARKKVQNFQRGTELSAGLR